MTEYVGHKPLFDQYLELKAENERLRQLVAGLPKCCTCGGIIKPEQGGQCMPCLGEETLPDSTQETPAVPESSDRQWLIRKRGYYYRPNRAGYTASIAEAGRYTEAEAKAEAAIEPAIMQAIPLSQAFDEATTSNR